MRTSDQYSMLVRTDGTPWRCVSTKISGRKFAFSVRDLPLGTYAARIVSDRGPFIDRPSTFIVSPTRQISLSIQTDTLSSGDRPVVWFNDNQTHGGHGVGIDSLPTTIAMLEDDVASLSDGRYIIRAWTKRGCDQSVVTAADTIVLISRPSIISHPQSVTAPANAEAILSIQAKGSDLELQLQRNGVAIAGAVEPRLVLTNLSASDEGDYTYEVSNLCGTIVSDASSVRLSTVSVLADGSSDDVVLRANSVESPEHIARHRVNNKVTDFFGRVIEVASSVYLPWSHTHISHGPYYVLVEYSGRVICLPGLR